MNDRNRQAGWARVALIAVLGGCGGDGNVSVGFIQKGVNLDVCAGTHIGCEPAVAAQALTASNVRSCDEALGPELAVEFSTDLSSAMCADPTTCSARVVGLAVASDATSWVVGITSSMRQDRQLLWAAHYDAEGEQLGMIQLDAGIPFNGGHVLNQADIRVDDRGHAFVFAYQIDGGPNADTAFVERVWFTELDADARIANGPNLLAGIGAGKIALTNDGTVMVAGNALQNGHYGVLAALTPDGDRLWSQRGVRTDGAGVGYGVVGLATESNHSFVLAERKRSGPTNDDISWGLMRFDDKGNMVWDTVFEPKPMFVNLTGDGHGNVLIGMHEIQQAPWLGRVLADGTADWSYEIGADGVTVDAKRELVYSVGDFGHPGPAYLAVIALDGARCTRYALPSGGGDMLGVDGIGGLYLAGGSWLSRVRLPGE